MVITEQNSKYLKGYEFIVVGGKKFKFHVSLKEGSSCMGYNSDLCVMMFTDNGFVNIVDNRFLSINIDNGYGYEKSDIPEKLSKVFDRFESYVREFMEM